MSKNATALAHKAEGNTFFKNKQYEQAIEKYTLAINADGTDVTFFSNRSACYAAIDNFQEAADDGRQCVMLDKNFVKGYYRAAFANQKLGNVELALDFVKRGLGIDSKNKDLKGMSRDLEEQLRQLKVTASITTTNQQLDKDDIYGAYRTLEQASRIDPDNVQLKKLMDEVRPKYEAREKKRIGSLSGPEKMKEQGDTAFKASQFEHAIDYYSKALNAITDRSTELALKIFGNRAACYKQLSNFDGTIGDCTSVLEYKENDVKALMRRAQAYEACERYKLSLQDVRQVLSYGSEAAGKANYDLANGMQHRLNKVIAQLKAMN
jgi:tetratricopeptide (TPR) repeat protein